MHYAVYMESKPVSWFNKRLKSSVTLVGTLECYPAKPTCDPMDMRVYGKYLSAQRVERHAFGDLKGDAGQRG
jgi:hypothetical protein